MIEGAPDMLTYRQNLSAWTFYEMHKTTSRAKDKSSWNLKHQHKYCLKKIAWSNRNKAFTWYTKMRKKQYLKFWRLWVVKWFLLRKKYWKHYFWKTKIMVEILKKNAAGYLEACWWLGKWKPWHPKHFRFYLRYGTCEGWRWYKNTLWRILDWIIIIILASSL